MELTDPSMPAQPNESRNYFLACYAVSLIQGQTILGSPIRHQTVVNYLTAAYQLLRDRNRSFESKTDYIEIILSALANYECIPNRRNMITDGMVQWFIDESRAQGNDSALASITDWIILGRYTGARASEWCQTTQSNYAVINEPLDHAVRDHVPPIGDAFVVGEGRENDFDVVRLRFERAVFGLGGVGRLP